MVFGVQHQRPLVVALALAVGDMVAHGPDGLTQMQLAGFPQRCGPCQWQGLHVGYANPMGLTHGGEFVDAAAVGVARLYVVQAPGAQIAGRGVQHFLKAGVAHGEKLGTDVKAAIRTADRSHASTGLCQAFVDMDLVPGL